MGKYINGIGNSFSEKTSQLVTKFSAQPIEQPKSFMSGLVCVVDNTAFAAAAWMYDEKEFQYWVDDNSGRQMAWFIVPNVETLAE